MQINRNTIFLRWILSFFSDTGNVTLSVFFRKILFLLFWQKGNIIFVTFIYTYRKYHISMYFLGKIIFHFLFKEKISYFWGKKGIPSFQILQKISYSSVNIFGKTIFSKHLKKTSYFQVFYWGRLSFIFLLKNKIIFSGKRNIVQERSYTSATFLEERPSFWNIWKKKIWFFMQWFMPEMHLKQPVLKYSVCGPFTRTKKEYKNLKKQEIHNILIKTNKIKLVFNMT